MERGSPSAEARGDAVCSGVPFALPRRLSWALFAWLRSTFLLRCDGKFIGLEMQRLSCDALGRKKPKTRALPRCAVHRLDDLDDGRLCRLRISHNQKCVHTIGAVVPRAGEERHAGRLWEGSGCSGHRASAAWAGRTAGLLGGAAAAARLQAGRDARD